MKNNQQQYIEYVKRFAEENRIHIWLGGSFLNGSSTLFSDVDISALNVDIESAVYYRRSAVPKKYSGLALYLPLTQGSKFEKVKTDLLKIGYPESIIGALGLLN